MTKPMDDSETFPEDFEELLDSLAPDNIERAMQVSEDSGDELFVDLNFGLQALTEDEREHVEWARMMFLQAIGEMTAFVLPYESASETHKGQIFNMCRWALQFRNAIRAMRRKMQGDELPEGYELFTKQTYEDWIATCMGDRGRAIH